MNQHTLFLILAPSATGKTELMIQLEQRGWKSIQSYTTRPRRNVNETYGHLFCDNKFYEQQLAENNISAYSNYNGYHYFCTYDQLTSSDLYVIDTVGAENLKKNIEHLNIRLVSIFIKVPIEERMDRMRKRGDSEEEIVARLLVDAQNFENPEYDYLIPNIDLNKAVNILDSILINEIK